MSNESTGPERGRPQTPNAAETASLRPTAATGAGGAMGSPPSAAGLLAPGAKFGRYTIVRPIGAGGMGAVYEATQESPRRSIALKVIRGTLSAQLLRRFEHESQVLGRLQHPGIAQVYEAGSVQDERGDVVPFFAMELIKGVPLTEYAAANNLGTRERLELVARICDAVYHAHQKGVIHRDLKPGNILVDESGQPKVLDFGVARATDSDIQQTTMQTDIGQLIGTVPYMSPEQVGGDPSELDTRSDVYALGVIAYELLAGRLPYDLQKKMIHEAVRVIREEDPTRLSSLNRTLRGDIETIVAKALEKDKQRRYQSAEALGSDIRRYLKDEPITARPASTWYQAAKFARRNKVLVVGVAATFAVLFAGVIGVSLMLKRALEAESDLTVQIGQTNTALKKAQEAEAAERKAKNEAIVQRDAAEYESYVANLAAGDAAFHSNQPAAMRTMLDACPQRLRGWEWGYLNAAGDASLAVIRAPGIVSAEYSPHGKEIAVAHHFCSVTVYDAYTGEVARVLGPWTNQIRRARYFPDGSRMLVSSVFHLLHVVSAIDGRVLTDMSIQGLMQMDAGISPDGARVFAGYADGCVRVFDATSGAEILKLGGHNKQVMLVRMSADGSRICSADRNGGFRLWDGTTGALVADLSVPNEETMAMVFSPDSRLLLAGGRGKRARLYDATTGTRVLELPATRGDTLAVAFSDDGSQFAYSEWQGTGSVRDTATGAEKAALRGYNGALYSLVFNAAGTGVLSGGSDKVARLWHIGTGTQVAVMRGHLAAVTYARFSPDGAHVLTLGSDSTVRTWDRAAPMGIVVLRGHTDLVSDAAFSPDGRVIVTCSRDGTVRVWDANSGEGARTFDQKGRWIRAVSFAPDGRTIAAGGLDGRVEILDSDTGECRRVLFDGGEDVQILRHTHGGGRLYCVRRDGRLNVWNPASGEATHVYGLPGERVQSAALSRDERIAAVLMGSGALRVVDLASGNALVETATRGPPSCIALSPDGALTATGRADGRVDLFNTSDGTTLASWQGHDDTVSGIEFSPDGLRLATASYDQTSRVWDTRTQRQMVTLRGHDTWINRARFSPDGTRIITAANDATVRIYDSMPLRERRASSVPAR